MGFARCRQPPPFINVAGTTMARTLFRSVLNNDICRLVGRSVFRSVGPSVSRSVASWVGRLVGLSVGRVYWAVDSRFVGLSACRSRRFVGLVVSRGGRSAR